MKFTIEAATLSQALTLASASIDKRNTVPILDCLLIEVEPGALRVTGTNLDSAVRLELPCNVETPGRACFPARALADGVKKLAKVRGAQIEFAVDSVEVQQGQRTERSCVAMVASGRSRLKFTGQPADDFPAFGDWEASETWTATPAGAFDPRVDGVALSDTARKVLAKVAKRYGLEVGKEVQVERLDDGDTATRLRVTAGDCVFSARLDAPDLYRSAKRDPFSYGYDSAASGEAERYLQGLRASLGLPTVDNHAGRLIVRDGRAVGLTVGEGWRDYNETRYREDWTPPAGVEVVDGRCTVDGVEYVNLQHDCGPGMPANAWRFEYRAERPGEVAFPAGAYSLPMPAGERRAIAAITVEVDGDVIPLRCRFDGGGEPVSIELDAAAVAELCGPVDPSTFVPIEALAFLHGRIIARGDAAATFNRLQADSWQAQRKLAKGRTSSEALPLIAAEAAAFAPVIEAAREGSSIIDASIKAAGGLPAEPEPVEVPESSVQTVEGRHYQINRGAFGSSVWYLPPDRGGYATPADVIAGPEHRSEADIADIIAAHVEAARPVEVEEAPARSMKDAYIADVISRAAVPEPVEPEPSPTVIAIYHGREGSRRVDVPGIAPAAVVEKAAPDPDSEIVQPVPEPAAPVEPCASLEGRLARIEAALGLQPVAKRSPAHAAAIRRAWRQRRALRAANACTESLERKLDVERMRADSAEQRHDCQRARLAKVESFATGERAELVAEVDRLRALLERESDGLEKNARQALRFNRGRRALAAAALRYRRDAARTRAERDGIAGNLAAMTRRVADDARTIEAMRNGQAPDASRRFILSSR
jgi:hypothetical protein